MIHFRLTVEQRDRLRKIGRKSGKQIVDVIRDALEHYFEMLEEKKRAKDEKPATAYTAPPAPSALGALPNILGDYEEEREGENTSSAVDLPSTIRLPKNWSSEVERFASYVSAARSEEDRVDREASVVAILRATTSSDDELRKVAQAVDDRVRQMATKKETKPETRRSEPQALLSSFLDVFKPS